MHSNEALEKNSAAQKLLIHLDDLGATKTITKSQIELIRNCNIRSGSLLMNGSGINLLAHSFKAMEKSQKIPDLLVHLNIVEGKPFTDFNLHKNNLTKRGMFNLNHCKIFRILYLSRSVTKKKFLVLVESEWDTQIKQAIDVFGKERIIGLDSHRHMHSYRQLNVIAKNLSFKYQLAYLRPTYESYFLAHYSDLLRFSYLLGLMRNLYLQFISPRKNANSQPSSVTGIIYSGAMTKRSALAGVHANSRTDTNGIKPMEVLSIFHPGCATLHEVNELPNQFRSWYLSKNRQMEFDAILEINQMGESFN